MKKSYLLVSVGIVIVVVIVAITVTLVLVLRKHKSNPEQQNGASLDDKISQNSTFPNGSYLVSVDSLQIGNGKYAPLLVNITMLNQLNLRVDNSSLVAETGRLSYFYIRLPPPSNTQQLTTSTASDDSEFGNIGIRFGNARMINVVPLNLSLEANSGLSFVGQLDDLSYVYQLEVRMAESMCTGSSIGSCTVVNWRPYALSDDNKNGAVGNFDNTLPVACGSQCDAASTSLCATSCATCDGQQVAGADTPVTRRYKMNATSGSLNFSYETYTIPDRVTVTYEGVTLFDSTCIGTEGQRQAQINFNGTSDEIRVDVEPNCMGTTGTAWYFQLPCVNNCTGCSEYQCLEDTKAHCGPKGYLLEYGLKYCNRFFEPDLYNQFDSYGQQFVKCVRPCLLNFLDNYLKGQSGSGLTDSTFCDTLTDKAFDSHVSCYLGCGFCNICKSNKLALCHVYDFTDFFSTRAIKQVYDIISTCGILDCFWGSPTTVAPNVTLSTQPPFNLFNFANYDRNMSSKTICVW